MSFSIKQQCLLRVGHKPRVWTVSFQKAGQAGYREDAALGLAAGVALGGGTVRNDFDRVSIFRRPIFNATWDKAERRWIGLVPLGDPAFTWSPTEPYREVVYRCQPFWYQLDMSVDYGPIRVSVTDRPLEGYTLAPMFQNAHDFVYRPCFEMALGEDGLPHSRAGLTPLRTNAVALMETARSYDSPARIESVRDWFSDGLLQLVEFATWNFHGVMTGNTSAAALPTGEALCAVTASSGSVESGLPCTWRGKENPWKNINSALCDLMLRKASDADGNYLEICYLPDPARFDGTLNGHYVTLGRYMSEYSGITDICGFREGAGFFYPGLASVSGTAIKGAAYTHVNYASTPPLAVAVGGGSSTAMISTTVQSNPFHFECMDLSGWRAEHCGARLILDEGGAR